MSTIDWVTGASSGIGRALALSLARQGRCVAVSARNHSALEGLAAECPAQIRVYPLDVTDAQRVAEVVAEIEAWGPIGRAFLNAGDYTPMPLEAFDPALFQRMMQVNYFGVLHGLDALMPYMRRRHRGEILVTASLAGYRGLPRSAPYSASKSALIAMAEALAPELEGCGIQLRLINPGFVRSPLTDKNQFAMPFIITPTEAAAAIMAQLEGGRFEITFPRRMKWLMQWLRLLPDRWFMALSRRMLRA